MIPLFLKAISIILALYLIGLFIFRRFRKKRYSEIEQVKFPIKTRIVAAVMKVFGALGMLASGGIVLLTLLTGAAPAFASVVLPLLIGFVVALIFFTSGNLLYKRKSLGWWLSLICLSILLIFVIFLILGYSYPLYLVIFVIVPLILLFLDRKNFFKIAT